MLLLSLYTLPLKFFVLKFLPHQTILKNIYAILKSLYFHITYATIHAHRFYFICAARHTSFISLTWNNLTLRLFYFWGV